MAEAAEPAEQMGIAAQVGECGEVRELGLEIGEEVPGHAAIAARSARSERGGESLDPEVQEVPKSEVGQGEPRPGREILGQEESGWQGMARGG